MRDGKDSIIPSVAAPKSRLLAHLLLERLIGSVGQGLLSEFQPLVAMWRGKRCQDQETKTSRSSKIQSVGGDQREEKRHAAAITRVVKFWQ
jgi:hypothetical protein